ncbi:MAG: hypothetical protein LUQ20_06950 [Candidatus Methanoperedens sp.]|nr:hypothetical protein [Candidatus Methanoperedens sp.]
MKFVALILLIIALAIPASASSVVSWTYEDITGYNLTLNYTSSFNVTKNDTLGIIIKNVGNESLNDTITVYEINVSSSGANGVRTLSETISPNSSKTFPFDLNVTTDDYNLVKIKIYYNVSSDHKTLDVKAYYPGAPEITPWNNKSNSVATTLTVNTSEVIRFNASADQPITTWKWYKDNVKQDNNDFFITSWNDAGAKTIEVNATNANGTSNTITWNVTVMSPSGLPAPNITSWSNSKTNNNNLTLTINETEGVTFNFTANQTLTFWSWELNGINITNPSDNLTHTFKNHGSYTLNAYGSNDNGSTQHIEWYINVLEKEGKKKNETILDWYPEVVDYVYVNGTVNETIEYSITTFEKMTMFNWTVDGTPVTGNAVDNTYYYKHTWDNNSRLGAHTIVFKGSNNDTMVEFRWYVNVYRIGEEEYGSGSIFDIIDDALENHFTDIKIRMFKYKIAKHAGKSEIAVNKVNQLHDEIAKRQMTREALRAEFKAGNITSENYTAAMKQVQREAKYNTKLAKEYAKISIEDLKDDKSKEDFKNISEMENKNDKRKDGANSIGKEDVSTKGKSNKEDASTEGKPNKEDASTKGKSKGNNKDNEHKNNGRGKD